MQEYPVISHRRSDRGRTFEIGIKFLNGLTPTELHLSCKKSKSDSEYIFHKTIGDGIALSEDGFWRLKATPEDTNIDEGIYFYDVTLEKDSDVLTLIKGELQITTGVTNE